MASTDKQKARGRDYYRRNRERQKNLATQRNDIARYGISYDSILLIFGTACHICGATTANIKGYRLHVDHDHDTGNIRGVLCNGCNTGLGLFKDNPNLLLSAIRYLSRKADVTVTSEYSGWGGIRCPIPLPFRCKDGKT